MIISKQYDTLSSNFGLRRNRASIFPSRMHLVIEARESRIGKKPIQLPSDVTVTLTGNHVKVQGPKGERSLDVSPTLTVTAEGDIIKIARKNDERRTRQLHGLNRALLNNILIGVNQGFEKKLTLVGVGFRAKADSSSITLSVGFTHDVNIQLPAGISAAVSQKLTFPSQGSTSLMLVILQPSLGELDHQ